MPMQSRIEDALAALSAALPTQALVTSRKEATRFEKGARYGDGRAAFVVRPRNTAELRQVVKICGKFDIRLLPQGANTGLVGASTPDGSGEQAILSTERMTEEFDLDVDNRSVVIGAGWTLSNLNEKLAEHGLFFPIDLGADPSIGGMVSCNTGGSRFVRYGDVRANLLGLEVVLSDQDATIVDLSSGLRKDNSGLSLKYLFVGTGAEAGIITRAVLSLEHLPNQTATALIVPAEQDEIAALVSEVEREYGHLVTAVEAISGTAASLAISHVPNSKNPFEPDPFPPMAVLIEVSTALGVDALDLRQNLESGLAKLFESGLIENGVIARGNELWELRHGLTEGAREAGQVLAMDISVPRSRIAEFRRRATEIVHRHAPYALIADFGHVADGGLHFNLVIPKDKSSKLRENEADELRRLIYSLVVTHLGGSFSAEHGIGPYNIRFYEELKPAIEKNLSALVFKAVLSDPLTCGTYESRKTQISRTTE